MDYSSLPDDPDHPAGTSPWQSSPQLTRNTAFGGSDAGSEPSSPLAKHSNAGNPQGGSADGELGGQDSLGNSIERLAGQGAQQGLRQNGQQQDALGGQERGQDYQQRPRDPQLQHQRPNQPARYHGTAQQRQRQNVPKYRLSAKITGLERTGRRDPILKFDVHVRSGSSTPGSH